MMSKFYFPFLNFLVPYKNLPLTMKYFYNQKRKKKKNLVLERMDVRSVKIRLPTSACRIPPVYLSPINSMVRIQA